MACNCNCFPCFNPPVTDDDTNTGRSSPRAVAPSTSTAARPSTSSANPSTPRAAGTSWSFFSCFKPKATDNTNAGPSPSTVMTPSTPHAAGPSTSTAAGPSTSHAAETGRVGSGDDRGKSRFEVGSSSQSQNIRNLPSFNLEELRVATNDFTSECLGEGEFGKVYKGYFHKEKQDVAIKKFKIKGKEGIHEFDREVEVLRRVDHPNIVKALGFCVEKEHRLLVYEHMALGSLDAHLFDFPPGRQPLEWNTRLKIAIDIASGLEYLHNENPSIIHCDLKRFNILLGDGYHTKLSDVGTKSVGSIDNETPLTTMITESSGYIAPEYQTTGEATCKSDIYSFGIVLLELITGKKAYDPKRLFVDQYLNDWVRPVFRYKEWERAREVVDPILGDHYPIGSLKRAVGVALWCANPTATDRPTNIAQVVQYLSRAIPPMY